MAMFNSQLLVHQRVYAGAKKCVLEYCTRPGKRLQKTMERSAISSWVNPLFRLGHGFNSYVCLPEGI